jgi:hypothetical protein
MEATEGDGANGTGSQKEKLGIFVDDRQPLLGVDLQASIAQLVQETAEIDRLEKSRTQNPMHLYGGFDDTRRNLVDWAKRRKHAAAIVQESSPSNSGLEMKRA